MLNNLFTMRELRDWLDQEAENNNHSHLHPGIEFILNNLDEFKLFVHDERMKNDNKEELTDDSKNI